MPIDVSVGGMYSVALTHNHSLESAPQKSVKKCF